MEVPSNAIETLTASPQTVAKSEPIAVKGYLNIDGMTTTKIFLEEVTWYEAREICRQQGFGRLDGFSHYSFKSSIVASALNQSGQYSNFSTWTGYFRPNITSKDWSRVEKDGECTEKNLTFDGEDNGNQCATNKYMVTYTGRPLLEMRNCSTKLPFVCTLWIVDGTNFTKYQGYDLTTIPTSATIQVSDNDFNSCLRECMIKPLCIGFSYNTSSDECLRVKIDFGFQYLTYEVEFVGEDVSHYTKTGEDAAIVEVSTYANITAVNNSFTCPSNEQTPDGSASPEPEWYEVDSSTDVNKTNVSRTSRHTTSSELVKTKSESPVSITATKESLSSVTASRTVTNRTPSPTILFFSSTSVYTVSPTINVIPSLSSEEQLNLHKYSLCVCNMSVCYKYVSINASEFDEIMDELVKAIIRNLTVDRKETHRYKSALISAEDNRSSSKVIGIVAVVFISLVFGLIVFLDAAKMMKHLSFLL